MIPSEIDMHVIEMRFLKICRRNYYIIAEQFAENYTVYEVVTSIPLLFWHLFLYVLSFIISSVDYLKMTVHKQINI